MKHANHPAQQSYRAAVVAFDKADADFKQCIDLTNIDISSLPPAEAAWENAGAAMDAAGDVLIKWAHAQTLSLSPPAQIPYLKKVNTMALRYHGIRQQVIRLALRLAV